MAKVESPAGAVKSGKYADVLLEMRERYAYATDQWQDIRAEATIDMRYVSGDPWEPGDRQAREDAKRPVLSFDEFGQYVNQLINQIRQHKRAIQVTPIGYGANEETATFRADLMRQIEYRSNAQMAYTTMFENTVQRSYGFLRIKPKYVKNPSESGGDGASFDQELLIEPIVNPDLVTIDPDAVRPEGSDMKYAFVVEYWNLRDYRRKFPRATIQDFDADAVKDAPGWMDEQRIRLAEYWTVETQPRTLLLFKGAGLGGGALEVFEDELKADGPFASLAGRTPDNERVVEHQVVRMYLTNGFEVLGAPTTWPTPSIPIVCCYGKVLYLNDGGSSTRKMLSLVRLARDPAMLYSYYRTCEAELVGMTPKTPFIGYEGQFAGHEADWQKAAHEPVAFLQAKALTEGTGANVLPLPQRQPYDPPIQALEIGAESARRAIQAAMGISPLPTQAQRRNEKSGIALQEIKQSEQQGSFHFVDAYEMAITRVGALLDELIPYYYDTPRDVTVRGQDDETRVVRINDQMQLAKGQSGPIEAGRGDHDVTLSTGPSYDSEREAASEFADNLAQNPQVFPLIGDLVVKLKNLGPIGDEIAERLHKMLPPPLQEDDGGEPNPMQLQAKLQQAMKLVEVLTGELNEKTKIIETDAVKEQAENTREAAKLALEREKLAADRDIKLRELEVKLQIELAKLGNAQMIARAEAEQELLHQHGEAQVAREEREAESKEAELDRQAERDSQVSEQVFTSQENARNRESASELADKKAQVSKAPSR